MPIFHVNVSNLKFDKYLIFQMQSNCLDFLRVLTWVLFNSCATFLATDLRSNSSQPSVNFLATFFCFDFLLFVESAIIHINSH
jgi:hypothetical protein